MTKVKVYNMEGKEVEELKVSELVFGLPENNDLVHQVVVAIDNNRRQVLAHTKNRGERAGSGRKPWKQKGTGRARVGSIRTPVWRKGGVAFGPRSDRNFKQKINKKMNIKAILTVLSGKLKDRELITLDKLEVKEKKTREIAKTIANLKLKGEVLMAFSEKEKDLRKISRNLAEVRNILTNQLNVRDMLNSKYLLVTKESIKFLEKKYGEKNKSETAKA